MTCGGTMDAPARKGETIVAYCIAQCKHQAGKPAFDATTPAFAFFGANGADDLLKENSGESKDQVE